MKAESVSQGGVNTTMKVFISYSRKDAAFVERLETALEDGKVGVTIDTESLAFGSDLHEFVERFSARQILGSRQAQLNGKIMAFALKKRVKCFSIPFTCAKMPVVIKNLQVIEEVMS